MPSGIKCLERPPGTGTQPVAMSTTTITQTEASAPPAHAKVLSPPPAYNFQDLARGDRNGKLKLQGIPSFSSPLAQRQWAKEHMAAAFRFFAKNGYAEGIAGHISMRGSSGRKAPSPDSWHRLC